MAIKDHDGYPPLSPFVIVEPMGLVIESSGRPTASSLRYAPTLTSLCNQQTQFLLQPKQDLLTWSKELHRSRNGEGSEVDDGEKVVIYLG